MATKKTLLKDGSITRDEMTGRFIEVTSRKGTSRASGKTEAAVKQASLKRQSALKRLADR